MQTLRVSLRRKMRFRVLSPFACWIHAGFYVLTTAFPWGLLALLSPWDNMAQHYRAIRAASSLSFPIFLDRIAQGRFNQFLSAITFFQSFQSVEANEQSRNIESRTCDYNMSLDPTGIKTEMPKEFKAVNFVLELFDFFLTRTNFQRSRYLCLRHELRRLQSTCNL